MEISEHAMKVEHLRQDHERDGSTLTETELDALHDRCHDEGGDSVPGIDLEEEPEQLPKARGA